MSGTIEEQVEQKNEEEVLITQQQENSIVNEEQPTETHLEENKPEISQIQQEIQEGIYPPSQTNSRSQSGLGHQKNSVRKSNNQFILKEVKPNPNHKKMQSISTHTVDLQSQSSQLNVPKTQKHSVISQSTSPIDEQIDNAAPFIPKPPLLNHIPITFSSPSLRIYNGGKKKRVRSDKEDLQFYRSPYHEKKYLGNQIYPPEPIKIQELPNSEQDLFTFKPQINQPAQQSKNKSSLQILDGKNVDIEFVEYVSSPIVVRNSFINNPSCLHNLVNKKDLRKTNSTNFVFLRTINLQENRKNIFTKASLVDKKHQQSKSQSLQPPQLQTILLSQSNSKAQIKEHNKNEYKIQGLNKIHFQNGGSLTQKASNHIKLPPFASSLESMNNFSIAKSNLIKYVNSIKL